MDIKAYIEYREKFTIKNMAKELGVSYSHLFHVLNKTHRASYQFAKKIESYTKGKVKAKEIMEWELKRKAPENQSEGSSMESK
jgi:predicted DNA-binding protein YlxM (UPF0122 family)